MLARDKDALATALMPHAPSHGGLQSLPSSPTHYALTLNTRLRPPPVACAETCLFKALTLDCCLAVVLMPWLAQPSNNKTYSAANGNSATACHKEREEKKRPPPLRSSLILLQMFLCQGLRLTHSPARISPSGGGPFNARGGIIPLNVNLALVFRFASNSTW